MSSESFECQHGRKSCKKQREIGRKTPSAAVVCVGRLHQSSAYSAKKTNASFIALNGWNIFEAG